MVGNSGLSMLPGLRSELAFLRGETLGPAFVTGGLLPG
jgi:hypothetical protein